MPEHPTDNAPPGLRLRFTLQGHHRQINLVAWSPDGHQLASASDDMSVCVWNTASGKLQKTLEGHSYKVVCIDWSPDGRRLVSGSDDGTIIFWDLEAGSHIRRPESPSKKVSLGQRVNQSQREPASIYSVAWSPQGRQVASGSSDGTVLLWNAESGEIARTIESRADVINGLTWSPDGKVLALATATGVRLWNAQVWRPRAAPSTYNSPINTLAWSPEGSTIALGSADSTIRIWDARRIQETNVIEGHAGAVFRVDFSADGRILASKSKDNSVRLWQCGLWEPLATIDEPSHPFGGLEFHPTQPLLATVDHRTLTIRIWEFDPKALLDLAFSRPSRRYANAKVVLVGDSGVGKSGLGLVLSGQRFAPTDSTHGRHVWDFQNLEMELDTGQRETRQTVLWDLAGQPGYRLIHQLHLNEVVVAMIVFDARSETDPLSGVRHWDRSLRQASLLAENAALPMKKFLVAARVDRGSIGLSKARIDAFLQRFGVDGYYETSAKEGWGIPELADAIRTTIDWSSLPRVSSTELFHRIKEYLIEEKQAGRILSSIEDLLHAFLKSQDLSLSTQGELRPQFETCVGLLASRGLVQRFSFGNLVLLQPEILDSYASAIVNAAKEEPDGLGSIAEETVRLGQFRMPTDERIDSRDQETLLLIATVEALLRHEIALREQTDQGTLLVFPSQLTRENPSLPDPEGKSVIFTFEGPLVSVYATLAVRLSHSGIFRLKEMWRNAATYSAIVGGTCGVFLREIEEARGELTLFFDAEASEQTRFQFEEFINSHLLRRALPDTIHRRRIFICPSCSTPVTELQAKRRLERGFDWIECNVCDQFVSLADREERLAMAAGSTITEMDKSADERRGQEAALTSLQGKMEAGDYDVFLCHASADKESVTQIGKLLREHGVLPWLEDWELRPGKSWQESLAQQFDKIKSVAVFVGPSGLTPWQDKEVRSNLRVFAEKQVPIIPVVLKGTERLPSLPIFFERLSWIDFRKNEDEALERLIWGITGERRGGR